MFSEISPRICNMAVNNKNQFHNILIFILVTVKYMLYDIVVTRITIVLAK